MPGDQWQKLANVRAFLAYMWAHPGKQLLFMGSEFGQPSEWSEQRGLDWWILDQPAHQGLHRLVAAAQPGLPRRSRRSGSRTTPSAGSSCSRRDPENNVVAFLRWSAGGEALACVFNFGGNPVGPYRIGLPYAGTWSRDRQHAMPRSTAAPASATSARCTRPTTPWEGRPASAELTLPPLAALWLKGSPEG